MEGSDVPAILVVDDEDSIRDVITRQLELRDYRIASVSSGAEALRIMADRPFDILLTDHMMQGMSGLDLIVETNKLYPDIVKILLTGYGDRNLYREAINRGAVFSVMEKPCDAKRILATVDRALDHRRRRLAERAEIERLRSQYHALFAHTTDLIQTVDIFDHFIYVNPAWYDTLGYGEEDIAMMTLDAVVHPSSRDRFRAILQTAYEGGSVPPFETVLVNRYGHNVYTEGSMLGTATDGGGTATFIFRDVSERRRAMEELRARLKEQTMVAQVAELFARTDEPMSMFPDVLAIMGETAGADRAYLVALEEKERRCRAVSTWQNPTMAPISKIRDFVEMNEAPWIFESILNGLPVCSNLEGLPQMERDLCRSFGITSILLLPVYLGSKIFGVLGLDLQSGARTWDEQEINILRAAVDIVSSAWTRQIEIDARRRKEEEAEQSRLLVFRADRLAALGTMTAGIIHEITQPLNAINVSAQTILYGITRGWTLESEQVQSSLNLIVAQIKRMTDIITNMRAFSRDGMPKKRTMTNLNDCLDKVLDMLGEQIRAHDIEVVRRYGDIPETAMNTQQILQVLLNLITNARQALDDHAADGKRIILSTSLKQDRVILEVADNGPGVPDEIKEKIFDPFFTTKEVGKGTGLGLAISASIVTDHKGELRVRDNEMGGTTVEMSLPLDTCGVPEES